MSTFAKRGWMLFAVLMVGIGLGLTIQALPIAQGSAEQTGGGGGGGSAGPRYTVVETEGHNLIVTDNQANKLYFYTVDKGAEIGSDLKLRGSVDLTQVGKDTITPKHHIKQKG
jgi:hypothetical protein